jgi:cystathionine beta-lyase/cystathionine gamma-synthase
MTESQRLGFETRAVHAGERPARPDFVPTTTPIYPSSSFLYEQLGDLDSVFGNEREGYVYSRYGNPTVAALEAALAALEGTEAAMALGSGMAALHAALLLAGVGPGARVVASRDLYGATYALLGGLFRQLGAQVAFVDIADLAAVERALADGARALVFETVSNPLVRVADVPALAGLAGRAGAVSICDNTFASPYLLQPAAHGVDLVVHSTTKYLGGHGDVMGGVVCASAERRRALLEIVKMTGGICGPFEAWLVLRGLKTLALRMRQHCANALTVATWLAAHPRVAGVNYPGLPGHPGHALAGRLLRDGACGGMLSFELAGAGQAEVFAFMERLRLIVPAPTLGDVYSLTLYPAHASHRALTPAQRAEVGIGEGLVRLSIGIEDAADIIADLEQALRP